MHLGWEESREAGKEEWEAGEAPTVMTEEGVCVRNVTGTVKSGLTAQQHLNQEPREPLES